MGPNNRAGGRFSQKLINIWVLIRTCVWEFFDIYYVKQCKWELFPKINKRGGPNKAMQVGKNPKKE